MFIKLKQNLINIKHIVSISSPKYLSKNTYCIYIETSNNKIIIEEFTTEEEAMDFYKKYF